MDLARPTEPSSKCYWRSNWRSTPSRACFVQDRATAGWAVNLRISDARSEGLEPPTC